MSEPLTWVIGRGGLIGGHVARALAPTGAEDKLWVPTRSIRWTTGEAAAHDLARETSAFLSAADDARRGWRIMWCAGTGVVATEPDALTRETQTVQRFVAHLRGLLEPHPERAENGLLFFTSSAGGVYAAGGRPPHDERSAVGAVSAYGREKLAQEESVRAFAEERGVDVIVGRFSNIYGPGQDLSKPQGLVAHVGRAALLRQPVSIYVPLDTIRDYLFAPDAGRMVAASLERRAAERRAGSAPTILTKILASEVDVTVASVLAAWRQALRRPLRIALAGSPIAELQPRRLSFRSRVWPDVRGQPTPLALGIESVRRDQLARLMAGELR